MKAPADNLKKDSKTTLLSLWRQFIPLSLSDVTMAMGDPLISTTLAHLPFARLNLAAVGVAKALAVFFESPIIMILHTSNTLAPNINSRRALWRFVLMGGGGLSLLLALLTLPGVFAVIGDDLLGVPKDLSETVRHVLMLMILWPLAISWRRYFQGLLIYNGNTRAIARASIARLTALGTVLAAGFMAGMSGALLAGTALITGVLVEAILVTLAAKSSGATRSSTLDNSPKLPSDLQSVWRFYWPLASSMLVVWGGRAMLVGIIARAHDAQLALAAWPTAWSFVLVIANATRMVQQIIIRNRDRVENRLLFIFTLTVGSLCSLLLLLTGITPLGEKLVQSFVGGDLDLVERVRPVLLLCSFVPLLVALQNAIQGFSIGQGRTQPVNRATWVGTLVLLIAAFLGVQAGMNGTISAALAMLISLITEITCLALNLRSFAITRGYL
jgi:progressive ankylosis protein